MKFLALPIKVVDVALLESMNITRAEDTVLYLRAEAVESYFNVKDEDSDEDCVLVSTVGGDEILAFMSIHEFHKQLQS